MSLLQRFRDRFRRFTVSWLNERPGQFKGLTVGYRVLWSMIAPLDAAAEVAIQSLQAPWPGKGTPTALSRIGKSRGMIRAQNETDDEYAARLVTWLDRARQYGSMIGIARAIHEYVRTRPRVRIYNRAGACVEVAQTTGAITHFAPGTTAWDWDSVSNPERAGYWWDLWICVYPTPWAKSGQWGDGRKWGARDSGIGHRVLREEYDAIKGEIEQYQSAHSHVRTVIWTSDATLFDPTSPGTQPDGTWGQWSLPGSDPRVPSGRNTSTCRYWEL